MKKVYQTLSLTNCMRKMESFGVEPNVEPYKDSAQNRRAHSPWYIIVPQNPKN